MFSGYPREVYQALIANSAITALVPTDRIKEAVADGMNYPYIWLDRGLTNEWGTKTSQGLDAQVNIHIASTEPSNAELDEIADGVFAALNFKQLAPADAQCVLCIFQQVTDTIDPDGVTRHRIMRFHLLIDKEDAS